MPDLYHVCGRWFALFEKHTEPACPCTLMLLIMLLKLWTGSKDLRKGRRRISLPAPLKPKGDLQELDERVILILLRNMT